MNFLESLAAEWLEYRGYFVRTNVRALKLPTGGYRCELDVMGYRPRDGGELIHIETSGDSDSWAEREKRFKTKKFILSEKDYEDLLKVPVRTVTKIAVVGQAKNPRVKPDWGKAIEVWSVRDLVCKAADEVRDKDLMSEGVPEGYPILRTMQMMAQYDVLAEDS